MPNRIIREGILTSEPVSSLGWAEEVFYRRLMSVVDDFGRYYASPKLLRAACYPLHIDKVSDSDIEKWLAACETAALVRVYCAADEAADRKGSPMCGKPAGGSGAPTQRRYLEMLKFRQQVRAKESRFPAFDGLVTDACEADAQQLRSRRVAVAQQARSSSKASAHLDVDVDVRPNRREGILQDHDLGNTCAPPHDPVPVLLGLSGDALSDYRAGEF